MCCFCRKLSPQVLAWRRLVSYRSDLERPRLSGNLSDRSLQAETSNAKTLQSDHRQSSIEGA